MGSSYAIISTALGFPTAFLGRRLAPPHPEDVLDPHTPWLSAPVGSPPIVDSLYRLVASHFAHRRPPILDHVVLIVGVSPATLKRHLHSAGLTYGRLLDRIRFDVACEMLSMAELSIKEISRELAYSSTSNFVRGFRRMAGVTPGEYRRRELGDRGKN